MGTREHAAGGTEAVARRTPVARRASLETDAPGSASPGVVGSLGGSSQLPPGNGERCGCEFIPRRHSCGVRCQGRASDLLGLPLEAGPVQRAPRWRSATKAVCRWGTGEGRSLAGFVAATPEGLPSRAASDTARTRNVRGDARVGRCTSMAFGRPAWDRTRDRSVISRLLSPLSYGPTEGPGCRPRGEHGQYTGAPGEEQAAADGVRIVTSCPECRGACGRGRASPRGCPASGRRRWRLPRGHVPPPRG